MYPGAVATPGERITTTWEPNGHYNKTETKKVRILYYEDLNKELLDFNERDIADVAETMYFATNDTCTDITEPNTVCKNQWTVPESLIPGKIYKFVWLWDYGYNKAGEQYSTCFDIKIVPNYRCPV
ncbi:hypothetical protein BB559_007184 [Furculomyces boomerangus]|nr:hypothetical protein BB559_007184 [Furculomyces boomerangus]